MRHLILIKQTPMIQLGHLYEHIFCMRVSEFFRQHDLFPYIDYSLDGKTYHGGVIAIDIELYTSEAIKLSAELPNITSDISKDIVLRAFSQLVAEKQEPFASKGYDVLESALKKLDEQPWQSIDEFGLVDTKQQRRQAGPIYITEGTPLPARKLVTSVLLDPDFTASHRQLLPLFRQLAWAITASLQETIANMYGYYSLDDTYISNAKTTALRNTFNVPNAHDAMVDIAEVTNSCKQTVESLRQAGAFEKFLTELRSTSYYERSELAPHTEQNYEDTLIFVGSKGWQELASEANCHALLEHMSIEVKSGRQKTVTNL